MHYPAHRHEHYYGLTFFAGLVLGLLLSLWIQAAQAETRSAQDNITTINQGE